MTPVLFILLIALAALPLLLKSMRSLLSISLWFCIVVAFAFLIIQPKVFNAKSPSLLLIEIDPIKQTTAMAQANEISSSRDAITAAQWQSFKARPINWLDSDKPLFNMKFQSITTVGRQWELQLNFSNPDNWSAELVDESNTVIAHSEGKDLASLRLTWLPVVAEPILLQLRIFDRTKKLIEQGPIAIDVQKAQSFNVQLELAAPSFDARALRQGIESSGLRWQVTTQLGAQTQWQHQSDREVFSPNIVIVDSRKFEQATRSEREQWLNRSAQNIPLLIVDFSNQPNLAYWKNSWNLTFKESQEQRNKLTQWPVNHARFKPIENPIWRPLTYDQHGSTGLWQHRDKKIVWLALQGWHDAQINSPNIVRNFWQHIFDTLPVVTHLDEVWQATAPMPLINQRTELCLDTTLATQTAIIQLNSNTKIVNLQESSVSNIQRCTAIWPSEKGWIKITGSEASANYYIYDKTDWPSWQKQLAHEAAQVFEARRPQQASSSNRRPIADWILIITITLTLLVIWWRETKFMM